MNRPKDRNLTVKDVAPPGACPKCGGAGYLRQNVEPDDPNFGKLIPCNCKLESLQADRLEQSQLHGDLKLKTFQNFRRAAFSEEARQAAYAFAQDPRCWLTLCGNFGNGKTHLGAAIVNHCRTSGIDVVFYTLANMMKQLRQDCFDQSQGSNFKDYLETVPVLVVDEILERAKLTDWVLEQMAEIFDRRYRHLEEQGTVLILNPDPREALAQGAYPEMAYLFSRMTDYRSHIVRMDGPDIRPVPKGDWISYSDPDSDDDTDVGAESDQLPEAA